MKPPKKRILIVGAGLAGLALCRFLDKERFEVDVVEKREAFHNLGFAIVLMPTGVRALRELGFSQASIRALGVTIQGTQVWDKEGKPLSKTDFLPFIRKFDDYLVVSRDKLYRLLKTDLPTTHIHFNLQPVTFLQKRSSVVVTLSDQTTQEYDLVVGADGVHSSVRKHLFPKANTQDTGLTFIWSWVPKKSIRVPPAQGIMDHEGAGIGFFDCGDPTRICVYLYKPTSVEPSQKDTSVVERRIWQETLKDFTAYAPDILQHLPDSKYMHENRDRHLALKDLYKGRMALIGDAAHVRTVFAGSGSGSALEDAVILGNQLNTAKTISSALKNFNTSQRHRGKNLVLKNLSAENFGNMVEEFLSASPFFHGK